MICKNTIYPLAGHIPAKYLDIELMTELSESINTPSRLDAVRVMLGAAFEWAIKTGTIHHSKRKHTYRIKVTEKSGIFIWPTWADAVCHNSRDNTSHNTINRPC